MNAIRLYNNFRFLKVYSEQKRSSAATFSVKDGAKAVDRKYVYTISGHFA